MVMVEQHPVQALLRGKHVRFEVAPHEPAVTAAAEARALRIPAENVLKAVIVVVRHHMMMAVLPASRRVDMSRLRRLTRDPDARLATEAEVELFFPGVDLGALPPIPSLFGIKAFVDPMTFDLDEAAFADGKQTESIIAPVREMLWGEDIYVAPISRPQFSEELGKRFGDEPASLAALGLICRELERV